MVSSALVTFSDTLTLTPKAPRGWDIELSVQYKVAKVSDVVV